MKERLHRLIDGLSENQIVYVYTLLSRIFGKAGAANG